MCWVLHKDGGMGTRRGAGRKKRRARGKRRLHLTEGLVGSRCEQQSVCQSTSGFTFLDYIMGLWRAIIVRSAFSLRYIMTHAENVIKILW